MDIQSTKLEIIQFLLNSTEESVLTKFKTIVENEKSGKIVAYSIDGKPLTLSQFQSELAAAELEIEKGDFMTSEALEREMASWK